MMKRDISQRGSQSGSQKENSNPSQRAVPKQSGAAADAANGAGSNAGGYLNGKDEMNLAEFPIARLGRSDTRLTIEYKGQVTDKLGNVVEQKWIVSGNAKFGLPTEFADRVLVALMYITSQENLKEKRADRRVPFTIYRIIKLLGLSRNQRNYAAVEKALHQLVGVTIYSEGAWWDHQQQKRITVKKGFHILEEFWLKSLEEDEHDGSGLPDEHDPEFVGLWSREADTWADEAESTEQAGNGDDEQERDKVTGYVVWGERIWDSFEAGYIKNLDVAFYYALENTLSRRLYRFLDKRMHYQESYQIDIFDLAARMGMKPYPFASHLARKLKPALDELRTRGFLAEVEIVKVGEFTRVRFVRGDLSRRLTYTPDLASANGTDIGPQNDTEGHSEDKEPLQVQSSTREGIEASMPLFEGSLPLFEPSPQCRQLWESVLSEYQVTLPPAIYAMLANSQLRYLDPNRHDANRPGATLTATLAVDARYHEWISRQMARQIKAHLNLRLDGEQRVKDLLIISQ